MNESRQIPAWLVIGALAVFLLGGVIPDSTQGAGPATAPVPTPVILQDQPPTAVPAVVSGAWAGKVVSNRVETVVAGVVVGSPATLPAAKVLAGKLADVNAGRAVGAGWLMIRSQARLNQVEQLFLDQGWKALAGQDPLAGIDWNKNMVVGYLAGEIGDTYALAACDGDSERVILAVVRTSVISVMFDPDNHRRNFILVTIPQTKEIKMTVAMRPEGNAGGAERQDFVELTRVLKTNGDIVSGLRGSIRAEKKELAAGEDIRVEFTLAWEDPQAGRERAAAAAPKPVYVWDGTYSEGYRNDAFLVETPDGKSQILRRPAQPAWDKNAPHPVEVKAGGPYVLPGPWKSLKGLGLDTTKPGVYRITGIYMETAEETDGMGHQKEDGGKYQMWGGNIATNTVEVRIGGGPPDGKAGVEAKKPGRALAEFKEKLDKALTPKTAEEKFGKPDKVLGSGLLMYVYVLDDGRELLMGFPGMGAITYAKVKSADGQVEDLKISR